MSQKINYDIHTFIVGGRNSFTLSEALRLWKSKYPEFIDFKKDVITHKSLEDFGIFVSECWDDIIPVTVQEALAIENTEIRRTYFDCIGVEKLFKDLQPTQIDKQVIKKKRHKWDDQNNQEVYEFEDVYELYKIDGEKLFKSDRWGRSVDDVFAVRCWCTTTNREYWLYVTREAAINQRWVIPNETGDPDAVRAIAWTIRLDVSNPEKIYRQGDIIVAKLSETSESVSPYHITKDQYLNLMYSET